MHGLGDAGQRGGKDMVLKARGFHGHVHTGAERLPLPVPGMLAGPAPCRQETGEISLQNLTRPEGGT